MPKKKEMGSTIYLAHHEDRPKQDAKEETIILKVYMVYDNESRMQE
jgi:hypothetical protein